MDSKSLSKILVEFMSKHMGEDGLEGIVSVKTFEDGNIKLYNDGLVLEIVDGDGKKSEYQLSIVQTK